MSTNKKPDYPRDWPRRRIDDFHELVVAAVDAVVIALLDGDGKHGPGSWMGETIENQLRHIENHIVNYELGAGDENHLANIVCRAAIAFALAKKRDSSRASKEDARE
jgi:hypothetical protein